MLKNNIEVDVKVKCIESGMTRHSLQRRLKQQARMSTASSKSKMVL